MTDQLTQLGVGGIFALLVIREVLGFVKGLSQSKGKRDKAQPSNSSHPSIEAITDRLDRIIIKLDEISGGVREAKEQAEMGLDSAKRTHRLVEALDDTMAKIEHQTKRPITGPAV